MNSTFDIPEKCYETSDICLKLTLLILPCIYMGKVFICIFLKPDLHLHFLKCMSCFINWNFIYHFTFASIRYRSCFIRTVEYHCASYVCLYIIYVLYFYIYLYCLLPCHDSNFISITVIDFVLDNVQTVLYMFVVLCCWNIVNVKALCPCTCWHFDPFVTIYLLHL